MDVSESRKLRLEQLIREVGSAAAVARACGTTPSYVSRLLGGTENRKMGGRLARKIEGVFGKPKGWMDQPGSGNVAGLSGTYIREVNVISLEAAARRARPMIDGREEESLGTVLVQEKFGPGAFALRVEDESMFDPARPLETFPPGTYIVVDPGKEAVGGSFVVVHLTGEPAVTFKRLVRDAGQSFLEPLNPRYPIIPLRSDAIIVGVVRVRVAYTVLP